ncbi:MAG: hypothetical protein ACOCRX_06095, partial [Candidatus Woesearchaeota archaeon]
MTLVKKENLIKSIILFSLISVFITIGFVTPGLGEEDSADIVFKETEISKIGSLSEEHFIPEVEFTNRDSQKTGKIELRFTDEQEEFIDYNYIGEIPDGENITLQDNIVKIKSDENVKLSENTELTLLKNSIIEIPDDEVIKQDYYAVDDANTFIEIKDNSVKFEMKKEKNITVEKFTKMISKNNITVEFYESENLVGEEDMKVISTGEENTVKILYDNTVSTNKDDIKVLIDNTTSTLILNEQISDVDNPWDDNEVIINSLDNFKSDDGDEPEGENFKLVHHDTFSEISESQDTIFNILKDNSEFGIGKENLNIRNNTDLEIPKFKKVDSSVSYLPEGWDITLNSSEDKIVFSSQTDEDKLAQDESVDLPIYIQSPSSGVGQINTWASYDDLSWIGKLEVEVDSETPKVENIAVEDKEEVWFKENENFEVDIEFNKKLGENPSVFYVENDSEDYTELDLVESSDSKTFVYQGETENNSNYDGTATIFIKDDYSDEIGNSGESYKYGYQDPSSVGLDFSITNEKKHLINIDRIPPLTPEIDKINNLPPKNMTVSENIYTNTNEFKITPNESDYGYRAKDNYGGDLINIDGGKAIITVNGEESTVDIPDTDQVEGYFSKQFDLDDNKYTVSIKFEDKVGNVGEESVTEFTVDNTLPQVNFEGDIDSSTPLKYEKINVGMTLKDETTGIYTNNISEDYPFFNNNDSSGYSIILTHPNDAESLIETDNIDNYAFKDEITVNNVEEEENVTSSIFTFPNTVSDTDENMAKEIEFSNNLENLKNNDTGEVLDNVSLPNGKYSVFVLVGDNIHHTKKMKTFEINTQNPTVSLPDYLIGSGNTRIFEGETVSEKDLVMKGTSDDRTVKVRMEVNEDNTEVEPTDKEWEVSLDNLLTSGVNEISVTEIDDAGNKTTEEWGSILLNQDSPTLEFDEEIDGTVVENNDTFTIKGTVSDEITKDEDIKVTIKTSMKDYSVAVKEDGSFSQQISLKNGINNITVIAEDDVGNKTIEDVEITGEKSDDIVIEDGNEEEGINFKLIMTILGIILVAIVIIGIVMNIKKNNYGNNVNNINESSGGGFEKSNEGFETRGNNETDFGMKEENKGFEEMEEEDSGEFEEVEEKKGFEEIGGEDSGEFEELEEGSNEEFE